MKHKHYDSIVAWAEGKTVQVKSAGDEWVDLSWNPEWLPENEYRLKPEPRTIWVREDMEGNLIDGVYGKGDSSTAGRAIKFVEVTDV